MMTGIEIVFFLLYCGLAVALALWASRVRMRSATPFSLTKLAFGHSGKGSAVPCVEEPERIISKGPDRGHCSPKLLLRERLREMASSFHAVLRRVRDRATIPR